MKKYTWHGSAAIHTPSGPVENGQMFESGEHWLSHHPQRQWVKRGLIKPCAEPKAETKAKK